MIFKQICLASDCGVWPLITVTVPAVRNFSICAATAVLLDFILQVANVYMLSVTKGFLQPTVFTDSWFPATLRCICVCQCQLFATYSICTATAVPLHVILHVGASDCDYAAVFFITMLLLSLLAAAC
jgi:hypothetical protein